MKKKTSRKLSISKTTVANLDQQRQSEIKGGIGPIPVTLTCGKGFCSIVCSGTDCPPSATGIPGECCLAVE
jgi:hypothetical protein